MKIRKSVGWAISFLLGAFCITVVNPLNANAGCNRFDITCNPHVKKNTKGIAERLWGEAGAIAYPAAAKIMRGRHGGSVGLDDIQKKYLRPHYGGLVDQVVVVYNAKMMSEWSALGKNISLSKVDSAAQAYCNRIYVKDSYQSGNRDQLLLLAHELRHAQQCQELGGEGKFGFHYFREYKRAGQNYENNSLEQSADERANSIASSVPNQLISELISQIQGVHNQVIGGDGGPLYVDAAKGILRRGTLQDLRNFLVDNFSETPIQRIHNESIGGNGGPLYVNAGKAILRRDGASLEDVRNFLRRDFGGK